MDKDEASKERRSAAAEVADRLRSRGIEVTGAENPEDLVDLLSAVERFEAAVEAHGGDLMVDDLRSSRPDDRHFVVPRRAQHEGVRAYIGPHRPGDGTAAAPSAAARLKQQLGTPWELRGAACNRVPDVFADVQGQSRGA
jgi:hypothetical protein